MGTEGFSMIPITMNRAGFTTRWLERFPALAPMLASAGLLGLFHAALLISRHKAGGVGLEELYDVIRDPDERYNVAQDHPAVVTRFREMLEPRLAAFLDRNGQRSAELTLQQLEALRSLGYAQ